MKNLYIDIHHHHAVSTASKGIRSYMTDEYMNENIFFSIGIHPWQLPLKNQEWHQKKLLKFLNHPNCLALGECGFDRFRNFDHENQQYIFEWQLKLAITANKPVIIHLVKAEDLILNSLKQIKPEIPLIFHAFNGSESFLKKLLEYQSYFSISPHLLSEISNKSALIKSLPLRRIFFETDDSEVLVCELYKQFALFRNLELESLIKQIEINFNTVFGR